MYKWEVPTYFILGDKLFLIFTVVCCLVYIVRRKTLQVAHPFWIIGLVKKGHFFLHLHIHFSEIIFQSDIFLILGNRLNLKTRWVPNELTTHLHQFCYHNFRKVSWCVVVEKDIIVGQSWKCFDRVGRGDTVWRRDT